LCRYPERYLGFILYSQTDERGRFDKGTDELGIWEGLKWEGIGVSIGEVGEIRCRFQRSGRESVYDSSL
jgi:hypothetical protein